jgi:biotin synthase
MKDYGLMRENLDHDAVLGWLAETNPSRLEQLWRAADRVRHENVGDEIHLRGLIEISNHCVRQCHYCGLRRGNRVVVRYRMRGPDILDCARQAEAYGFGSVVLQAGEDEGLTREGVADVIRAIKAETRLAVTLSLGERTVEELRAWRAAGADRYLLRFETSNEPLFARIHPPVRHQTISRMDLLRQLAPSGFEAGSGVMVGIPGQTLDDLARDLRLFQELDLDMIGIGPFIAHPDTPLGQAPAAVVPGQVEASEVMTYKMVALARLLCPEANIPSTTALSSLNFEHGRELGLQRGANVVMPNLTPFEYRRLYAPYPAKACLRESAAESRDAIVACAAALGRRLGQGPGPSARQRRPVPR